MFICRKHPASLLKEPFPTQAGASVSPKAFQTLNDPAKTAVESALALLKQFHPSKLLTDDCVTWREPPEIRSPPPPAAPGEFRSLHVKINPAARFLPWSLWYYVIKPDGGQRRCGRNPVDLTLLNKQKKKENTKAQTRGKRWQRSVLHRSVDWPQDISVRTNHTPERSLPSAYLKFKTSHILNVHTCVVRALYYSSCTWL